MDRLADVVPVGDPVAQDVGEELARAEALAQGDRGAGPERGLEAQEHRVGVEQGHAGVADVVAPESQLLGDAQPHHEELEVVVVDSLGETRRARRVDHHQVVVGAHLDVGAVEGGAGGADLGVQAGLEVAAVDRGAALLAQDQHVVRPQVAQVAPDPLELGQEALVHHQEPRPGLVDHPGQGLPAQTRVETEEGASGVGAARVDRQQLRAVLQHHRHVAGAGVVDPAQATAQEVGGADGLVAELSPRPAEVALAHRGPRADLGMEGARLELRGKREVRFVGGDGKIGSHGASSRACAVRPILTERPGASLPRETRQFSMISRM